MHPVIRGPARQYLPVHSQIVTTRRGRGCNVMHDTPRQLSPHRGIGIASESTETQSVQDSERVAGEGGCERGGRGDCRGVSLGQEKVRGFDEG